MVTDCGVPTTGWINSKSADKPLLIFLDEREAHKRQGGILGELYEVKIEKLRKSDVRKYQEQEKKDSRRRLYEKLKAEFEPNNSN